MKKKPSRYYTSIEQGKKLVELGVDPKTADMFYMRYKDGEMPENGDADLIHVYDDEDGDWYSLELWEEYFETDRFEGVPCWSLGALLDIIANIKLCHTRDEWWCDCIRRDCVSLRCDNPIEAVFDSVVTMIDKGYIE